MSSIRRIHNHPVYEESYDENNSKLVAVDRKLRSFLLSSNGDSVGERLKGDLVPFKAFPRGHTAERCIFIICKDCKKKAIVPVCSFCEGEEHSEEKDAVLFHIHPNHDKKYKVAKKAYKDYEPKKFEDKKN